MGKMPEAQNFLIPPRTYKKHPKLSQICSYEIFSKGLKNEFETAVVNESSVFEPLKFYCKYAFRDIGFDMTVCTLTEIFHLDNYYCFNAVSFLPVPQLPVPVPLLRISNT